MHWNGTAWTRARLPATVTRGVFTGVAATSSTNAWAVGYDESKKGGPLIVHWNGTAWTRVWLPDTVHYGLSDVAATSAKNVWILGSAILHWNGRKWTCALLPKKHSPGNLFAISSSSADNAWAVGDSGSGTGVLALHWNGHSWTQIMTPQADPASALFGLAVIPHSGRAWVVGSTGGHETLMLHWNGTAWHWGPTPRTERAELVRSSCESGRHISRSGPRRGQQARNVAQLTSGSGGGC